MAVPTIERTSGESAPDTDFTLLTPTGKMRELLWLTVTYVPAAQPPSSVQIHLKSGLGPNYHNQLGSVAMDPSGEARFVPPRGISIVPDDQIEVKTFAGGAGVKQFVAIYTRRIP